MIKKVFTLIVAVAVCELAGALGSIFTAPSVETWYATIYKAPFNPPNWIFGPVWILLFLLMGIALFLVWNKGRANRRVRIAIWFFILQLCLNVLWSVLFFGAHSPFAAFVEIIALWLAILWTMILFFQESKTAGWLLVPYIAWVSFAAVLNYFVFILN